MRKWIIITALLFPLASDAKFLDLFHFGLNSKSSSNSSHHKYKLGLLKKISCKYRGVNRKPASVKPLNNVEFADPDVTVCDPLAQNAAASPDAGLLGKLILRSPEMGKRISGVMDYYNKGNKLDINLYFADINVPTRSFTAGFQNQNGDYLVDAQGNKLIEHFAIEYTSILKLAEGDKEGHYELASLSDDGARVFVKENGAWNEIINNDGDHATQMGCAFRTVHLKRDTELPLKVLYYQGPRYHIANVMLWKHHNKAQSWKKPNQHSLCGYASNNYYFDSNNNKKTAAMKYLESTGWSLIAAANYKMPEQQQNPCAPAEELAISDFVVDSLSGSNASLSWKTNVPASSQLRIRNAYTGEVIFTPLDSTLVTDHQVSISGLERDIYYVVEAISVDASGKEARSGQLALLP